MSHTPIVFELWRLKCQRKHCFVHSKKWAHLCTHPSLHGRSSRSSGKINWTDNITWIIWSGCNWWHGSNEFWTNERIKQSCGWVFSLIFMMNCLSNMHLLRSHLRQSVQPLIGWNSKKRIAHFWTTYTLSRSAIVYWGFSLSFTFSFIHHFPSRIFYVLPPHTFQKQEDAQRRKNMLRDSPLFLEKSNICRSVRKPLCLISAWKSWRTSTETIKYAGMEGGVSEY